MLKGLLYNNVLFYELITKIKLGGKSNLRYQIVSKYVEPNDSVLDVCAGTGEFKKYIPKNCEYYAVERSENFSQYLQKKNITNFFINLHDGLKIDRKFDTIVMIISLYSFKNTNIDNLITSLKKIANKRVVILEEVFITPPEPSEFNLNVRKFRYISLIQKIGALVTNYLCCTSYFKNTSLFHRNEFLELIKKHQFKCQEYQNLYTVALYEKNNDVSLDF